VTESIRSIAPEPTVHYPTVDIAWSAVMERVRSIAKGDYNKDQGFKFRGIDAVLNHVGPALRDHGVKIVPKKVREVVRTEYLSKTGSRMVNTVVTIKWQVRGPGGDAFTGESVGEAADSGDKSITKAQSVAYRQFLIESLCIATGDIDPDSESHERATVSRRPQSPADTARDVLRMVCKQGNLEPAAIAKRFGDEYGKDIRSAESEIVEGFTQVLRDEIAAAKAAQDTAAEAVPNA
jgi:hypothetical protein